jgi:hypothetical protein
MMMRWVASASASASCATPWNFGAPCPRSTSRFAIQRIMSSFSACTITSAPSRSATLMISNNW